MEGVIDRTVTGRFRVARLKPIHHPFANLLRSEVHNRGYPTPCRSDGSSFKRVRRKRRYKTKRYRPRSRSGKAAKLNDLGCPVEEGHRWIRIFIFPRPPWKVKYNNKIRKLPDGYCLRLPEQPVEVEFSRRKFRPCRIELPRVHSWIRLKMQREGGIELGGLGYCYNARNK